MAEKESEKAAVIEGSRLRDYDLVMILSPEIAEDRMGEALGTVTQFIDTRKGVVSEVEQWGRRKLAYPIKHFMEGNYVLARVRLEPELTKELDASLKISEEVLRHLLVRTGE